MAQFPDITSPQSYLEIILDNWGFDARGDEPTKEEYSAFFRWVKEGGEPPLEEPRPIQVYLHFLDKTLGGASGFETKVFRVEETDGPSARTLEELARKMNVYFEKDDWEWNAFDLWVEELCARQALGRVANMPQRWKELRFTQIDEDWSQKTCDYLEEAAECYLFERYRACVALCRSSLEVALKEACGYPPGSELGPRELEKVAKSQDLLPGRWGRFAQKVRITANNVIHPVQAVNHDQAKDILEMTGEVIEQLATA